MRPVLVWFRSDLRVIDNPALDAAVKCKRPLIPVFIHEDGGAWSLGGASKWWLHRSLESLGREFDEMGAPLVLRSGEAVRVLGDLVAESGATDIFFNRQYEPAARQRDVDVQEHLGSKKVTIHRFAGNLLFDPSELRTKQGGPYKVYTPFMRACFERGPAREIVRKPANCVSEVRVESLSLEALKLLPSVSWDRGFVPVWSPGRVGAERVLERFITEEIDFYDEHRNLPGIEGTSRLSPHLRFGEISPLEVWSRVHDRFGARKLSRGAQVYLQEILWREFGYHLLFHFPTTPTKPLREEFQNFPWSEDRSSVEPWTQGRTGFPIVDAGMRQLWETGWMHNRVRMIVASFLVKNLRVPWQIGSEWFWDTLVDADLASNTLGWQWVAGCGADAAPYFRVFNPVLQGEKFDADGKYVRRFVPEIAALPDKFLHKPWEAPRDALAKAGIELGTTYPRPIVDLGESRDDALKAYRAMQALTRV